MDSAARILGGVDLSIKVDSETAEDSLAEVCTIGLLFMGFWRWVSMGSRFSWFR